MVAGALVEYLEVQPDSLPGASDQHAGGVQCSAPGPQIVSSCASTSDGLQDQQALIVQLLGCSNWHSQLAESPQILHGVSYAAH